MESYSQLQQELSLLCASQLHRISDLEENGKKFKLIRPMYYVLNFSQHNYNLLINDMRKRLKSMRKKMNNLQLEMNDLMQSIK